MTFPHIVPKGKLSATIYGKSEAYPFYRMAVQVAGKRVMRSFATFGAAKAAAKAKLKELAYLERQFGRAGKLALNPLLGSGRRDVWELQQLAEKPSI